jgi:hypothetical protein
MRFNPILGSDLSGHLGGVVGSHNTYGVYFRRRAHPVNPMTAGQIAQRTALQVVSQSWRELDAAVQEAWKNAQYSKVSRKGFPITLTGQGFWMYVNLLRQRCGLDLVQNPPVIVTPSITTAPAMTLTAPSALSITWSGTDSWDALGGAVIVSAGGPLSSGVSYWQRFSTVGTSKGPTTPPVAYVLPFAVVAGDRVRVRYHATDPDGVQSVPVDVDVTAV